MKPVQPKDEESKCLVPIENIFERTDYKNEDYILNSLIRHIEINYSISKTQKVKKYYCSMIAILQSSGYGKSKLMEKLGSRTPTIYSSLQQGSGYPPKSYFLVRFLMELDEIVAEGILKDGKGTGKMCHMNNVSMAVYVYILRILFIILKNPKNQKIEKSFSIDPEIEKHPFFSQFSIADLKSKNENIFGFLFRDLKSVCRDERDIIFSGLKTLSLNDNTDENDTEKTKNDIKHNIAIIQYYNLNRFMFDGGKYLTENLEEDVKSLLEELRMKNPDIPAIFVIDEAHGLRNFGWSFQDKDLKEDTFMEILGRSPYTVFRRTFRIFTFTWEMLMLIVISTNGQISILLPELTADPSRRPQTSAKFMKNFSLISTHSVNSEIFQKIKADMFDHSSRTTELCSENWMTFLDSNERKIEYFKFGRPLIWGVFKSVAQDAIEKNAYNLEADFDDCQEFHFMAVKLFGGKKFEYTEKIGLLYSMLNFAFGVNFLPSFINREDLINNHLMTLVKYIEEDKMNISHIVGGFYPEGVINFLSARYFALFHESLLQVLSSSLKSGLCDIGVFGELIAQYILLYSVFSCNDESFNMVRKMVFQPVLLENFLLKLANDVDNGAQYPSSRVSAIREFFVANIGLKNSKVSFGYFEHFMEYPLKRPFDLMAKCLFRGSAVTLNKRYPGIDLMIPLVLGDSKMSFLGIQVKYVSNEEHISSVLSRSIKNMKFSKISHNAKFRPFGLIIFIIGNYTFDVQIHPRNRSILVYKGVPPITGLSWILQNAPVGTLFRGVQTKYLRDSEFLYGITSEDPPELSDAGIGVL